MLKAEHEHVVGAEVTIAFPPFVKDRIRLRAIGWCVVPLACMAVLILLGFSLGHSHALELTDPLAAIAASDGGKHCPAPTHTGARAQCHASTHVCCILPAVARPNAAVATPAWGSFPEPRFSDLAIAPIPRPPAFLIA